MKHKILKIDPYLKPFEKDFDLRMENYRRKKEELLAPGQTLADIYELRTPIYQRWADATVKVELSDNVTERVVEQIMEKLDLH